MKKILTILLAVAASGLSAQTTWPVNSDYVYWGSGDISQSSASNYALLQARYTGDTYLNSPVTISFRINNTTVMYADHYGQIGIGTSSPGSYQHGGTNQVLEILNPGTGSNAQSHVVLSTGTTNSSSSLGSVTWAAPNVSASNKGMAVLGATFNASSTSSAPSVDMFFYTRGSSDSNWQERMRIAGNGNVGIGTADPQGYKLAVNGSAIATSMRVKAYANWPDYVFDPGHSMPSLGELATYIKQNRHLPEIPTASEVEKNGIELGEMNAKLLKKVEELTLYLIEMDKRLDMLQRDNELLKTKIK